MRIWSVLFLALEAVVAAPTIVDVPQAAIVGPNSWIVKLRDDALLDNVLSNLLTSFGLQPTYTYSFGGFQGFAIDSASDILGVLSSITAIELIEPNTRVEASAVQENAPWGLARISHRERGATEYVYDESAGGGTFAYIVDTGIYAEHEDFGGRAVRGESFVPDEPNTDLNGHGTHVAGTIGSTTYGVAKDTTLIGVKVLGGDGSGTNAQVLAGLDWAVNNATASNRIGKAVANLSLGGIFSPMTNRAAAEAVAQGLFLAVAAGNSALPTFTSSPASEVSACTVGATDKDDNLAEFSNYGVLVDVLAPGVNITSLWIGGPEDVKTISGTSMASPHVAGLGAYLLGLPQGDADRVTDPDVLCDKIKDLSTKGAVALGLKGLITGNRLAFNGFEE